MNILLPYPDYAESAKVFDDKMLSDQIDQVIRALDILHQLPEVDDSWRDHPAVRAWAGYEVQLAEYGLVLCEEQYLRHRLYTWWVGLVRHESQMRQIMQHLEWATSGSFEMDKPKWFGMVDLHCSHQAELLRLDPEYYGKYFKVDLDTPMVWPIP